MMVIGKIVSIQFNQFRVRIFSNARSGAINIGGEIYYFGNIGGYLKTSNTFGENILCEVIAIFDSDKQNNKTNFDFNSERELILKPIGTYKKGDSEFSIGIGTYPSLYSDVKLISNDDLDNILKNDKSKKIIHLGVSKNHINYNVDVSIDKLFGIHSAILGNSGSGKSNTISHILQEIYRDCKENEPPKTKIIIFDINGEYKSAFLKENTKEGFCESIKVKLLKPNIDKDQDNLKKFCMPYFLFSIDEWCAFLMAKDATQKPFWKKVLKEACELSESTDIYDYLCNKLSLFCNNVLAQSESDTVKFTTLPSVLLKFEDLIKELKNMEKLKRMIEEIRGNCGLDYGKASINEIIKILNRYTTKEKTAKKCTFDYKFLKLAAELILLSEETKGSKSTRSYVETMLTRLDDFLNNKECLFMREGEYKDKEEYINYLLDNEHNLVIIDTSELGKDVLEMLTNVIARIIFDYRTEPSTNRQENPVHIVLDEAHRYIKKDQKYIFKENIFEKIAREGRKYSLYLLISSQRPSELSETVLSQCGNFIIHRIQNDNDMKYINAILPYFSEDFIIKIKQSIPGEAIVFGQCVPMPIHIKIKKANPEPNSRNCEVSRQWYGT